MTSRRIPLVPLAVAAIAVAGALAAWAAVPRRPAFHGTTYETAAPAAGFRLVDGEGKTVTPASFRGAPLLLFFGYTRCTDFCPQTLGRLSRAVHGLGDEAKGTRILLVTVDPAHDTPAVLKAYAARFGPFVSAATGDSAALAAAWQGYGAYVAPGDPAPPSAEHAHHGGAMPTVPAPLAHSGVVYGIDRTGLLQVVISASATEAEIRDDVRALAGL